MRSKKNMNAEIIKGLLIKKPIDLFPTAICYSAIEGLLDAMFIIHEYTQFYFNMGRNWCEIRDAHGNLLTEIKKFNNSSKFMLALQEILITVIERIKPYETKIIYEYEITDGTWIYKPAEMDKFIQCEKGHNRIEGIRYFRCYQNEILIPGEAPYYYYAIGEWDGNNAIFY